MHVAMELSYDWGTYVNKSRHLTPEAPVARIRDARLMGKSTSAEVFVLLMF